MKIVFMLIGLLCFTIAEATTCQTIEDAGQRAYCRALQTNNRGQCMAIENFDLRQRYHAVITGNVSLCNSISSGWEREQCKVATRGKNDR